MVESDIDTVLTPKSTSLSQYLNQRLPRNESINFTNSQNRASDMLIN